MDLGIRLFETEMAVCRLPAEAPVPEWVQFDQSGASMTRTRVELSIVCPAGRVPDDVDAERGWFGIEVEGPLVFTEPGILARLSTALAEEKIPIFAISTYLTDYLLVPADRAHEAMAVLGDAGCRVLG